MRKRGSAEMITGGGNHNEIIGRNKTFQEFYNKDSNHNLRTSVQNNTNETNFWHKYRHEIYQLSFFTSYLQEGYDSTKTKQNSTLQVITRAKYRVYLSPFYGYNNYPMR